MKPIQLNLTPRRKEVLWHAAYSTAEWSAGAFLKRHHAPIEKVMLGRVDVTLILRKLRRLRLVKFKVDQVGQRKHKVNVRITPLGMDVLLGNVECVDPRGIVR